MVVRRRASHYNQYASLSRAPQASNDADGFFEPLSPPESWIGVQPILGSADGRTLRHLVTMPFHPQVSLDTRILIRGTTRSTDRNLFVVDIANIDDLNVELQLTCEEVLQ